MCYFLLNFGVSGILLPVREGEQSFEGRNVTIRRAGGTTGWPEGALLESVTTRNTTGRKRYRECQCVRYHRSKERKDSATTRSAAKKS